MPRKLPDLLMLAIFILVISIPLTTPMPPLSTFQDQSSTPQSAFSTARFAKAVVDFPPALTSYFEDHHLLHQLLVNTLLNFRLKILRESVFPNVLIGKEDWLYYTGENNIADYECTSPFTSKELKAIRARLQDWNDQLTKRGIKFYIVFAPNKEAIYPQFLPDLVKPGIKNCRIDQVMQELQTTQLAVLDLRGPMQTQALSTLVYHRTDTHWNSLGALPATREILSLIKRDFPQLSLPSIQNYQEKAQPFRGDLASFLPTDERFIEQSVSLLPLFRPMAQLEEVTDRIIVSSIPGSDLPRTLVFRDSFSDALIPFLAEHFSRTVFTHSFSVDFDLVVQEKPDIVIFELAQRYLTVLR